MGSQLDDADQEEDHEHDDDHADDSDSTASVVHRISRLIVDGARPSPAAIARTPRPRISSSAITIRSACDRYRADTGSAGRVMAGTSAPRRCGS